jgi:prefoldin subunit 5
MNDLKEMQEQISMLQAEIQILIQRIEKLEATNQDAK